MVATNRYEDDDAYHLPPGMKRVGYDERTERYTFRQGEDLWLGEPGSFYGGMMKWAGKCPDVNSESSEDSDCHEDYDTDGSEESKDNKSFEKHTSSAPKHVARLPYLQESKNEWGVPVVSISETNAKPPDVTLERRRTQLKKVAASTVTAIRVTRRWTRKKASSRRGDQGDSPIDKEESEKGELSPGRNSFVDKALPTLPAN